MNAVNPSNSEFADALLRENFYLFAVTLFEDMHGKGSLIKAPYLEALCFALQNAAEGDVRRFIATLPPRYLKSFCASIALPAFLLGKDPWKQIMVVVYGDQLGRDHAATFRQLIETPRYRRLFPHLELDPRNNRLEDVRTSEGGYRRWITPQGAGTGFGADLIVIDDIMKASEARSVARNENTEIYLRETLLSRLNQKKSGRIIAALQRLGVNDFASLLIEGGYEHLNLPVIAEGQERHHLYQGRTYSRSAGDLLNAERESQEDLEQLREDMGSFAFAAQYNQNPLAGDSIFLDPAQMNLIEELPDRENFGQIIQSWDTAVNDGPHCDYSACITMGFHLTEERWYILDVTRIRAKYPELKDKVMELRRRYKPVKILIENSAVGPAIASEFRRERHFEFTTINVRYSKEERFAAQTDWIQSNHLAIPVNAPWYKTFRDELFAFPNAQTYDDQVDALVQAIKWIRKARMKVNPVTGRPQPERKRLRRG